MKLDWLTWLLIVLYTFLLLGFLVLMIFTQKMK